MDLTNARSLDFSKDGARLLEGAARASIDGIRAALLALPSDHAGLRLHGVAPLDPLLRADGPVGGLAADMLGEGCRPVRALLFDKTATTNWSLAWHQDRTICVAGRLPVAGFGPWTVKRGLLHVAPPYDVLAAMVTLRIHLDPVPATNAPLLIAPGSHRLGRITEGDIENIVNRCGRFACLAETGDVWAYATPILHASEAAVQPTHRRVLQVDYAADDLPGGLQWLGL